MENSLENFKPHQTIQTNGQEYDSWEVYQKEFPNHLGSVGVGKNLDTAEFLTKRDSRKVVEAVDEKYGSTAYEEGLYRAKHCSIFVKTSEINSFQIRTRDNDNLRATIK